MTYLSFPTQQLPHLVAGGRETTIMKSRAEMSPSSPITAAPGRGEEEIPPCGSPIHTAPGRGRPRQTPSLPHLVGVRTQRPLFTPSALTLPPLGRERRKKRALLKSSSRRRTCRPSGERHQVDQRTSWASTACGLGPFTHLGRRPRTRGGESDARTLRPHLSRACGFADNQISARSGMARSFVPSGKLGCGRGGSAQRRLKASATSLYSDARCDTANSSLQAALRQAISLAMSLRAGESPFPLKAMALFSAPVLSP